MNFELDIKQALKKQASLLTLREIVYRYKQYGGTQKQAYRALEKIRHEYSDDACEDLVLDLMDVVAGFCSKDQRLWNEVLTNS